MNGQPPLTFVIFAVCLVGSGGLTAQERNVEEFATPAVRALSEFNERIDTYMALRARVTRDVPKAAPVVDPANTADEGGDLALDAGE